MRPERRYSDADLDRLQRILFYRELGFLLEERIGRLREMAAASYTKEDWKRFKEEMDGIHRRIADAMARGAAPDSDARRHQSEREPARYARRLTSQQHLSTAGLAPIGASPAFIPCAPGDLWGERHARRVQPAGLDVAWSMWH